MRGLAGSLADLQLGVSQHFHEVPGLSRLLNDISRHETSMRVLAGPLADIQRAWELNRSSLVLVGLDNALRAASDWEARFRLPGIVEASRLVSDFQVNAASDARKRYEEQSFSLQKAMEDMRTPWMDAQESLRSVTGFAALQGMGHELNRMPAFGDHLVSTLRDGLGDWRDTITWPTEIFSDLVARSDFYVGRGFDPALTTFPTPAFEQSLEIAKLRREPPPLVERYGSPVPISDDSDEEEGLVRTNTAHNWLLRLEMQVRKFIDVQMTDAFGVDWPRHRLPNGLYDEWQEKMQAAIQAGCPEQPLIAYADFTDYVRVICKRDNWKIFKPFFGREESVRESFQRLHPVRLCTMHARLITQDDELFLYVETKRLLNSILGREP
jgi:hypothetical protein